MVVVFPTSSGDTPGGTPIILAASEIGNTIALPTSAGDTPGGTPMALIASARGIVDGASDRSAVVSPAAAFGLTVVAAGVWAGSSNEVPGKTSSGIGELGAASCGALASRRVEGITITFILRVPFTSPRNA